MPNCFISAGALTALTSERRRSYDGSYRSKARSIVTVVWISLADVHIEEQADEFEHTSNGESDG
jgi:hypothetical protein